MTLPCVVDDIESYLLYEYNDKENKYAIGSIKRDRFIEVDENNKDTVLKTIKMMDGTLSFKNIDKRIKEETGFSINSSELYSVLAKADLLASPNNNAQKSEFETVGLKIFDVNIEKCKNLFKAFSSISTPLSITAVVLMLFTFVFVGVNHQYLSSVSLLGFQDNYIRNFVTMFLVMTITISLHEIAHGITASKYGITPQKLSLSLYLYISPIVYIKLPGLYTVKPKARIHIWLSGVIINSIICCLGIIASIILTKNNYSDLLISISNYVWYINLIFVIVNLCPLMPLDGYFVLATIMKIPNLRRQSFISMKNSLKSRKIQMTFGQFVYFLLSIIIMGYVVIKEIYAMVCIFIQNLTIGVADAFWSIKHYILIVLLIIIIRIIRSKAIAGNKRN